MRISVKNFSSKCEQIYILKALVTLQWAQNPFILNFSTALQTKQVNLLKSALSWEKKRLVKSKTLSQILYLVVNMVNTHSNFYIKLNIFWCPQNWAFFCFPPFSFINQPRARATSSITAVPEEGSAAPYVQASLWFPTITSRSKKIAVFVFLD